VYRRFGDRLEPPVLLPMRGTLEQVELVLLASGPAVVWSADSGGAKTLWCRTSFNGRFLEPQSLLTDSGAIAAIAAAGQGETMVVAAVAGATLGRVQALWLERGRWSEWTAPPGWDRAEPSRASGVRALLDGRRRARLVVRARPSSLDAVGVADTPHYLVEWVALPRTISAGP
jgi:hypothetical protein